VRTRSSTAFAALVAIGLGAACSEPPSYRLRWSVDEEVLSVPSQCSSVGVLDVRVRTIDAFGRTVDISNYPCFDHDFSNPDRTAPGPSLPPGDYAVEVRGLTRNGSIWTDDAALDGEILNAQANGNDYLVEQQFDLCRPPLPIDAPGQDKASDVFTCRPESMVCDCTSVTVEEEKTPTLDSFDLTSPPECVDGLDNDGDGLVDALDTACRGNLFGLDVNEAADITQASFRVAVTFFSGNPDATCASLKASALVDRVLIELGTKSDETEEYSFETLEDSACDDAPQVFSQTLTPGDYKLRVTLLSASGEPLAAARESAALEVISGVGGSFNFTADFAADDFDEPITAPAVFVAGFYGSDDQNIRYCSPGVDNGFLTIDKVRLGVLDGHGAPISTVFLEGSGSGDDYEPGPPLDGVFEFDCRNQAFTTEPLAWGDYLVTIEALSAEGDVCFSNVDAPTAVPPSASISITPERVSSEGSCRDCDTDGDCGDLVCDAGQCVAPCEDADGCDG